MARFRPKATHQGYPGHLRRMAQRSGLGLSYRASRIRFRRSRRWPAPSGRVVGQCTESYTLLPSKVELTDTKRSGCRRALGARAPGMRKMGSATRK